MAYSCVYHSESFYGIIAESDGINSSFSAKRFRPANSLSWGFAHWLLPDRKLKIPMNSLVDVLETQRLGSSENARTTVSGKRIQPLCARENMP